MLGESLPDHEIERIVAARGERQRLLDTDREFVLIMTEDALRWHIGSSHDDRAAAASRRDHQGAVTCGWASFPGPSRCPARLSPLRLYDRRAAIVGTETATAIITDARDIADYETCFATYEALAVYDADARQVFRPALR